MMKLKTICWSVALAFSAAGCAYLGQPAGEQTLRIQPQLEVSQGGPEALYRLGRYQQGQRNYDRAIAAYREALQLDPSFVDARNGLGAVYLAQGRYDDAVRELRAAIAIAPHLAYLHNNLGYAYLLRGSNEPAISAFQEAVRLDPGQQRALQNLKLAQSRIGVRTAAANTTTTPSASAKPKDVIAPLKSSQDRRVSVQAIAPNIFQLQIPRAPAAVPLAPPTKSASAPPMPLPAAAGEVAPRWTAWMEPERPLTAPPERFRLEVSNGNGVNGLAKRIAQHLKIAGLPAIRLTNQRPFKQPDTEIQYRKGYASQAAALRSKLQDRVLAVENERLARYIDVRLVLGRDYRTEAALFLPADAPVQVGMLVR